MRRISRWALFAVLAALAAVALLAVPLGGWEHVDRAEAAAERLAAGEVHEAEPFATAVLSAEVVRVRPGSSLDPEPGVTYLVVHTRLADRVDETRQPPSDHLVLAGTGLGAADTVVLDRDPAAGLAALQPGLPDDVSFVWELDDGSVEPGDTLRVQVVDRTEIQSRVGSGLVPIDPRVGAVVEVAVS